MNPPSKEPVLELAVNVVRGQMKFSLPSFTVKPSQRVKITFTNPDEMQHNLVVVKPGTLDAVGALADAMAKTPDAAERNYIPPTPDVIVNDEARRSAAERSRWSSWRRSRAATIRTSAPSPATGA